MITLGTVTISDNMYLSGVEQASPIATQQDRTVDGNPNLTVLPTPGGRQLTLGTSQIGNAIQGIWCQHVVDALKVLQSTGDAQVLNYQGTLYLVVISSTAGLTQLFQREPLGPNKRHIGLINLQEV